VSQQEREQSARIKQAKVDQLKELTEDELQADLIKDKPYIPSEESDVEVRVRQIRVLKALTTALEAYTSQSKKASDRLETLTKWLVAFTVALVLLGIAVLVRDLTH
jgi:hypothetical protein